MFCKHCGKQIDNDSKFCIYCGSSLRSINIQVKHEQIVSPQTVKKLETVFGINLSKPVIGSPLLVAPRAVVDIERQVKEDVVPITLASKSASNFRQHRHSP
jgi:hypothetical protein